MQNYTTIVGIIELRSQKCSYDTVQKRYSIGSGTVTLIMNRYKQLGVSLDDLRQMESSKVEAAFYELWKPGSIHAGRAYPRRKNVHRLGWR